MMIEDFARPDGRRYINPYEQEAGKRPAGLAVALFGTAAFALAAMAVFVLYLPGWAFGAIGVIALTGLAARLRVLHRIWAPRTA